MKFRRNLFALGLIAITSVSLASDFPAAEKIIVEKEKRKLHLLKDAVFAIPALGLSLYLHHAYSIELESLFGAARQPQELFRYLPVYTVVAGGIGFAIGWIVGRNV